MTNQTIEERLSAYYADLTADVPKQGPGLTSLDVLGPAEHSIAHGRRLALVLSAAAVVLVAGLVAVLRPSSNDRPTRPPLDLTTDVAASPPPTSLQPVGPPIASTTIASTTDPGPSTTSSTDFNARIDAIREAWDGWTAANREQSCDLVARIGADSAAGDIVQPLAEDTDVPLGGKNLFTDLAYFLANEGCL